MGFSVEVAQVVIWAVYGWQFIRWGPFLSSEEEAGMSEQDAPTVDFGSTTRTTEGHTTERGPHD